ncbi:MAG: hypothetical protein H8F28_00130 [Fibrella sp.]|nr:hypothetical protein [Armatimonadota bacterium]
MIKNSLQIMHFALLTLMVGTSTCATANAETYYVSPTGADNGVTNGDSTHPWAKPSYIERLQ